MSLYALKGSKKCYLEPKEFYRKNIQGLSKLLLQTFRSDTACQDKNVSVGN